jgi:hypothetical protein
MEEKSSVSICERGNELVSFLYGEIDQREARDFERHMRNCAECRSELGAFREIRESIIAWRDESLNITPGLVVSQQASSPTIFREVAPRKRSASAAIRQFFDLSPLWMKGAVSFASFLFCVLAILTVVRVFNRPGPVVVSGEKRYTEKEVAVKIDDAVNARLAEMNRDQNEAVVSTVPPIYVQPQTGRKPANRFREPAKDSSMARRRPLSKAEREQLAADLRLISPQPDSELDLLGDRLNQ